MNNKFIQIAIENSDTIVKMWLEKVDLLRKESYSSTISNEVFENANLEFVNVIFKSIKEEGSLISVVTFSEKINNLGWPLSYITDGLQIFRSVTIDFILSQSDQMDTTFVSEVLQAVDEWVAPLIRKLVNEFTGAWENVLSIQQIALQELSAPLIPVTDGITIMPLIGTIDTDRAKLIMENLLEGAIKHNSEVVLIDITGVPVVDTMVAHHIIQAAEAVRLIGATCILVGIRPEIAQTIVSLGIDLTNIPTKSSLVKGFISALEITNRKIIDIERKEDGIKEIMNSLQGE